MKWRKKGTMKPKRRHEGTRKCFRCARELAKDEGIDLGSDGKGARALAVFCNAVCRSRPFDCPKHGTSGIYVGEGGPYCGLCEKRARTWVLYALHDADGDDYWADSEPVTEEEQYH